MAAQQKLLVAHFEKLGGQVELQRFTRPHPQDGSPVPMANIIVRWNPQARSGSCSAAITTRSRSRMRDPDDPRGVFVGPTTTPAAMAILMELAHHMAELRLPFGVDFVLFDGEEFIFQRGRTSFFLGSEYFARQYAAGHANYRYRCGVLLDMVGSADLQIYQEHNSVRWQDTRPLVEQIWATAARLGVGEFIAEPKYEDPRRPRAAARHRRHSGLRRD